MNKAKEALDVLLVVEKSISPHKEIGFTNKRHSTCFFEAVEESRLSYLTNARC